MPLRFNPFTVLLMLSQSYKLARRIVVGVVGATVLLPRERASSVSREPCIER